MVCSRLGDFPNLSSGLAMPGSYLLRRRQIASCSGHRPDSVARTHTFVVSRHSWNREFLTGVHSITSLCLAPYLRCIFFMTPVFTYLFALMLVIGLPDSAPLEDVLGVNQRIMFSTETRSSLRVFSSPSRMPGQPAYGPEVVIPAQVVTEGLAFLAAYKDRNVLAMAALGTMSLWDGTLRRGVDAARGDSSLDLSDLHRMSDGQLKIFAPCGRTKQRKGRCSPNWTTSRVGRN